MEIKKNIPSPASLQFEQIEELTNLIHFRDYKNHVLKLMRLKTRNNNQSEKNNSQTASEAPLFKMIQESRPESPSEEVKRENQNKPMFNSEGFRIPEIILADTDSLDDQRSNASGVLGRVKIQEKLLGKRISSVKKKQEGKHPEIIQLEPLIRKQSQDKQQSSPTKVQKAEKNLNKRKFKAEFLAPLIESKQDGEKQIESIEQEQGDFIESYLKMTGAFNEAIQFVHEFQNSLKRQLEIGKYCEGDRLNIELKVKIARNP